MKRITGSDHDSDNGISSEGGAVRHKQFALSIQDKYRFIRRDNWGRLALTFREPGDPMEGAPSQTTILQQIQLKLQTLAPLKVNWEAKEREWLKRMERWLREAAARNREETNRKALANHEVVVSKAEQLHPEQVTAKGEKRGRPRDAKPEDQIRKGAPRSTADNRRVADLFSDVVDWQEPRSIAGRLHAVDAGTRTRSVQVQDARKAAELLLQISALLNIRQTTREEVGFMSTFRKTMEVEKPAPQTIRDVAPGQLLRHEAVPLWQQKPAGMLWRLPPIHAFGDKKANWTDGAVRTFLGRIGDLNTAIRKPAANSRNAASVSRQAAATARGEKIETSGVPAAGVALTGVQQRKAIEAVPLPTKSRLNLRQAAYPLMTRVAEAKPARVTDWQAAIVPSAEGSPVSWIRKPASIILRRQLPAFSEAPAHDVRISAVRRSYKQAQNSELGTVAAEVTELPTKQGRQRRQAGERPAQQLEQGSRPLESTPSSRRTAQQAAVTRDQENRSNAPSPSYLPENEAGPTLARLRAVPTAIQRQLVAGGKGISVLSLAEGFIQRISASGMKQRVQTSKAGSLHTSSSLAWDDKDSKQPVLRAVVTARPARPIKLAPSALLHRTLPLSGAADLNASGSKSRGSKAVRNEPLQRNAEFAFNADAAAGTKRAFRVQAAIRPKHAPRLNESNTGGPIMDQALHKTKTSAPSLIEPSRERTEEKLDAWTAVHRNRLLTIMKASTPGGVRTETFMHRLRNRQLQSLHVSEKANPFETDRSKLEGISLQDRVRAAGKEGLQLVQRRVRNDAAATVVGSIIRPPQRLRGLTDESRSIGNSQVQTTTDSDSITGRIHFAARDRLIAKRLSNRDEPLQIHRYVPLTVDQDWTAVGKRGVRATNRREAAAASNDETMKPENMGSTALGALRETAGAAVQRRSAALGMGRVSERSPKRIIDGTSESKIPFSSLVLRRTRLAAGIHSRAAAEAAGLLTMRPKPTSSGGASASRKVTQTSNSSLSGGGLTAAGTSVSGDTSSQALTLPQRTVGTDSPTLRRSPDINGTEAAFSRLLHRQQIGLAIDPAAAQRPLTLRRLTAAASSNMTESAAAGGLQQARRLAASAFIGLSSTTRFLQQGLAYRGGILGAKSAMKRNRSPEHDASAALVQRRFHATIGDNAIGTAAMLYRTRRRAEGRDSAIIAGASLGTLVQRRTGTNNGEAGVRVVSPKPTAGRRSASPSRIHQAVNNLLTQRRSVLPLGTASTASASMLIQRRTAVPLAESGAGVPGQLSRVAAAAAAADRPPAPAQPALHYAAKPQQPGAPETPRSVSPPSMQHHAAKAAAAAAAAATVQQSLAAVKPPAAPVIDAKQIQQMLLNMPHLQPDAIADKVFKAFEKKMKFEQRRSGF
ncbi:hypothetical protein [Paenibacillus sp. R14(2021)]|uniref:hypothetical protein n=1 Tax=Paenibacillus sp. R14(2021) TaxID=2859228 RepID=UPI001C615053|nr:hypothetical protein [Paenibacillus sp. R14(2021)]